MGDLKKSSSLKEGKKGINIPHVNDNHFIQLELTSYIYI